MRHRRGEAAIKAIVLMGILAFVLLFAISLGLKKSLVHPKEQQRVRIKSSLSAFDGKEAYALVKQLSALGPRTVGTEAHQAAQDLITAELEQVGISVIVDPFQAQIAGATLPLTNLYVLLPGSDPNALLLVAGYDTPSYTEYFAGANDGASATAWLLEWARFWKASDGEQTMIIAWLDGQGAAVASMDSQYTHSGAERLLQWLDSTPQASSLQAVISLEAIGDCYLNLSLDRQDAPELAERLTDTADRFGYGQHLSGMPRSWQGIHTELAQLGVESLGIGDFEYGGSLATHQQLWHTKEDTVSRVCDESLQLLADILYHAIYSMKGVTEKRNE